MELLNALKELAQFDKLALIELDSTKVPVRQIILQAIQEIQVAQNKDLERRRFRYDIFLSAAIHGLIARGFGQDPEDIVHRARQIALEALSTEP